MASPLAGNLMRIGQSVHPEAPLYYDHSSSAASLQAFQASRLASHIFFQLIRESPWHVTRTKSLPAAYLTPALMGTLWGLGALVGQTTKDTKQFQSQVRKFLRDHHGIKSNYIKETEWTGVSLARWMDLVLPSSSPVGNIPQQQQQQQPEPPLLVSAVWLMALWEKSESKLDFLECLVRLEETLPPSHPGIFDTTNPLTRALLDGDDSSSSTARQEWAETTFSKDLDLSSDQIHEAYERICSSTKMEKDPDAKSLEIICAALSLHHFPLKSKPAVPTGYYGFDGGGIQADCAEMTVREILNLLLWDEESARFDTDRLPSTASPRLLELYEEPFEDSGGAWFDVLSDLPGCDYFLKSPNGRPYELVPSISNVVKAIQILLMGRGEAMIAEPFWTSFQDVSDYWRGTRMLQVHESTLTHRSKTSGNLIHHEFATLRLETSPLGIELRLRYDMKDMSGMSKVTHMRERKPLPLQIMNARGSVSSECSTRQMLDLCLMNESEFDVDGEGTQSISSNSILEILGTAYGCDRRTLITRDLSNAAIMAETEQSEKLLKAAITTSCHATEHDELWGATLLPWLLQESLTVFESDHPVRNAIDTELEAVILDLPINVLGNNTVHDALEYNPAVRGKLLMTWARWKGGSIPLTEAMAHLKIYEVPEFLKMAISK